MERQWWRYKKCDVWRKLERHGTMPDVHLRSPLSSFHALSWHKHKGEKSAHYLFPFPFLPPCPHVSFLCFIYKENTELLTTFPFLVPCQTPQSSSAVFCLCILYSEFTNFSNNIFEMTRHIKQLDSALGILSLLRYFFQRQNYLLQGKRKQSVSMDITSEAQFCSKYCD